MNERMSERLEAGEQWASGSEMGLERQARFVSCMGLQAMLRRLAFVLSRGVM